MCFALKSKNNYRFLLYMPVNNRQINKTIQRGNVIVVSKREVKSGEGLKKPSKFHEQVSPLPHGMQGMNRIVPAYKDRVKASPIFNNNNALMLNNLKNMSFGTGSSGKKKSKNIKLMI